MIRICIQYMIWKTTGLEALVQFKNDGRNFCKKIWRKKILERKFSRMSTAWVVSMASRRPLYKKVLLLILVSLWASWWATLIDNIMMLGIMIGILALGAVGSEAPETGKRPRWYGSTYYPWEQPYSYKPVSYKMFPLWYFYYYGVIPRKFIHQILGFRLNQYFKNLLMNRALLWTH